MLSRVRGLKVMSPPPKKNPGYAPGLDSNGPDEKRRTRSSRCLEQVLREGLVGLSPFERATKAKTHCFSCLYSSVCLSVRVKMRMSAKEKGTPCVVCGD